MLIKESFLLALSAIRANKMRAFLTMLGIIIGVGSVIGISSIGSSVQSAMQKEFDTIGANLGSVGIDWAKHESEPDDFFSAEDVERVKEHFKGKIIYMVPDGVMKKEDKEVNGSKYQLTVNGVDRGFLDVSKDVKLLDGRMITAEDVESQNDVVVIDEALARKVTGSKDVIGQKLELEIDNVLYDMTIVGVTKQEVSAFSKTLGIKDSSIPVYIPYTIFDLSSNYSGYITFYHNPDLPQDKIVREVKDYVTQFKQRADSVYKSESSKQVMDKVNGVLAMLSLAIGAIAGISLLVGGIGIMNIMLVSVTERTREIGIRKALGAKTGNILFQFLIESSILSLIGGSIGILLGVGIGNIGVQFAKVSLSINPLVIIGALIFSSLVGMFFGLYPAKRAAKLDPIEALRYE